MIKTLLWVALWLAAGWGLILSAQNVIIAGFDVSGSYPAAVSEWLLCESGTCSSGADTGTTATDSIGSNDLTLTGGVTFTSTGADIDGVDGSGLLGGDVFNIDWTTESFSASYLMNGDNYTAALQTFGGRQHKGSPFTGWNVWSRSSSAGALEFAVYDGGSSRNQVDDNGYPITAGDWESLIVTYDGSTDAAGMLIYVNGQVISMTTVHDTLTTDGQSTADFWVGATEDGATSGYALNGVMAISRMWDVELSAAEVILVCEADESIMSGRSATTQGCP